jgi:internalin A
LLPHYQKPPDTAMSELALKLIAENKKTRSPFLDLGNCGLTEVPEEIGELVWLEELSFASEWLGFYGEECTRVNSLNSFEKNNIKQLLSSSRLMTLPIFGKPSKVNPFSNLTNLRILVLRGEYENRMGFCDLTPLSVLFNLQQIDISYIK